VDIPGGLAAPPARAGFICERSDETSLTRLRSLRQRMLEEERTVSKELCGRDGSGAGEPVAGYVGLVVPLTSGCASHGVESVIRKTRTAPHPHRCGRVPEDL
jgi:hypothetical protein